MKKLFMFGMILGLGVLCSSIGFAQPNEDNIVIKFSGLSDTAAWATQVKTRIENPSNDKTIKSVTLIASEKAKVRSGQLTWTEGDKHEHSIGEDGQTNIKCTFESPIRPGEYRILTGTLDLNKSITVAKKDLTSAYDSDAVVPPLTINNTGKWPKKCMVGYVDLKSDDAVALINEDQVKKYNVIVFGFTDEHGNLDSTLVEPMQKIIGMEAEGTINLISIGGEHSKNLEFNEATATNLKSAVLTHHLDGVDFDVENLGGSAAKDLVDLAIMLRKEFNATPKKDYFITAAPQLAGNETDPALVVAGGGPEWSFFSGVYDAVLVQAYNSGLNFKYHNPMVSDKALIDESNPDIVAAAYDGLQKNGFINTKTEILIGIPCNAGAAPSDCNLWNNTKTKEQWDKVTLEIGHCINAIEKNTHGINGSQFGGLMMWSLGNDAFNGTGWEPKPIQNAVNSDPFYFSDNVAVLIK